MKVAIIGRTEILYDTVKILIKNGYTIPLIITAKEAPEYKTTMQDFEILANQIGSKYKCTACINDLVDYIRSCGEIDIALSLNYPNLISQDVISCFRLGILNAHGGDLPKYKGNACQAWAILNGESHIGLCIHFMIAGDLDSGAIVERNYLAIDINTKITVIWEWMAQEIPYLFLNALQRLKFNPTYILEEQSRDSSHSLRCYPRILEDGKIDWKESNISILRLINASNKPYSGAYCFYNDQKIVIWDATLFEDEEKYLAKEGHIIQINADQTIVVATGFGKLRVHIIETNGWIGKPACILNSIRIRLH